MPHSEKRQAPRVWFCQRPAAWVSHGNGTYEAKCVNVSTGGVALQLDSTVADPRVGDNLVTALMAPRQCATASGTVVYCHEVADQRHVLVSFNEQPRELTDLIRAALSCTYQEFAAGCIAARGERAALRGWLSQGLARDIEHVARTCRVLDMTDVREVDADGLAALVDARRRFGITIANCNERVARIIRDSYARSLCTPGCENCPADDGSAPPHTRNSH